MNRRQLEVACASPKIFLAVAALIVLASAALWSGHTLAAGKPQLAATSTGDSSVISAYHGLPLVFEQNRGQSDPEVKFLAHGSGYGLFLTAQQAVLRLRGTSPQKAASVVRMTLAGANSNPAVQGTNQLPGKSNYFIGNDPAKWHTDVPQFARVRYHEIYPGIDLVYYGKRGQLEYDFEGAPGSDPTQINLQFQGAPELSIDASGNLVVQGDGNLILQAPRIYQRIGNRQQLVDGRFELRGKSRVGFSLGVYDRSRVLIIDPVLIYSTYLGGSSDEACTVILNQATGISGCPAVAVDTALNAYIAGSTDSTDFPKVGSPFQSGLKGTANVFISKFNSAANTLLFSTYLGGGGIDTTVGLTVDAASNVIVGGNTTSSNFPTNGTNAAFQATPLSAGHNHAFVSKLDNQGHTLIYSTYLSGNGIDTATGLALDISGNAYITGSTTSTEVRTGFPSTLGSFQPTPKAPSQFFLTKINPALSGADSVPYSTYFGGSTPSAGQTVGGGIAVDVNSDVYITGGTNFTDMPILNAFQAANAGGLDVFVAELNPAAITGTQLVYSTYIGGTGDDIGYGVAVDSGLEAYVTGSTTSTDFPAAGTGVFQDAAGGGRDAFLAKLGVPGTNLVNQGAVPLNYFTYLGGTLDDVGLGIVVDNNGQAIGGSQGARITGWTASADFPVRGTNLVQGGFGGAHDAFVARIDTTATSPTAAGHYATFLGGNGDDFGTGIAVDFQGASYVAGETKSANFLTEAPPQNAPFQPTLAGGSDAFLSKLGPVINLNVSAEATPSTVGVGNQVTFTYTIENDGDFVSGITFTDTLQPGASFVSASTSTTSNACGQPSGGTVLCNIGALNSGGTGETGGTATVTIVVTPIANTTPSTTTTQLSNSGTVTVAGSTFQSGAGATVFVNDFNLAVAPAAATVPAGVPAQYTVTIAPTGIFTGTISVACSSGLPTAGTCTETTPSFQNLNGNVSTDLIINTTQRVSTTTQVAPKRVLLYALGLPLFGLVLGGFGWRKTPSIRRSMMGLLLGMFISLAAFQAGCSSSSTTTTTSGTPAGTYVITVAATSGNASRMQTVTLVVQ